MREVVIAGVGIHPFGRFPDKDYRDLGREATLMALKDANVPWKDIQVAYVGNVMAEMTKGHQVLQYFGQTGIPIINVENACTSGSVGMWAAMNSIQNGEYDLALVLGVEKAPKGMIANCGYDRWQMYTGTGANPAHFAMQTKETMWEHGLDKSHLAYISVLNHRNGVLNPNAMYRKECTAEEVLNSPMVCDPLTLLMLCAPNEGAAAAVIGTKEAVKKYTSKYVTIAALAFLTKTPADSIFPDFSVPIDTDLVNITTRVSQLAYETAGIGPEDLSLIEMQDTDSGSQIRDMVQAGLIKPGDVARALADGDIEPTGRIPVNVSGGLLSKGEPLGASSMGQIVELTWQLRGEAGERQVKGAKAGAGHTLGAAGNSCFIVLKN
jgi:acetyl-CoA acetyltransferase